MQTLNSELNEWLAKVKRAFREALVNEKIKQEVVANLFEVNQSTIQRYTDPDSTLDLPAGALPVMHRDERLRPVAEAIMATIGARFVSFGKLNGLDGSIDDEILMMVELEGALAEVRKKDMKKAQRIISRMKYVIERMEAEIEQQLTQQ